MTTDKTSTAPVMAWISRTALPRVNPAQMVRIAKSYARVDQQHSYTQVDDFMPHDWVVAAMCTAYDAGRQNIIDGTHTHGFTPDAIESVRRIFGPTPDVVGGDVVAEVDEFVADDGTKKRTVVFLMPISEIPLGAKLYAAQPKPEQVMPDGWKLVPLEPTAEIIADAAAAAWPAASKADVAMAMDAAKILLQTHMEAAPGTSLQQIAASIATMAPAYRAMVAAAPSPERQGVDRG